MWTIIKSNKKKINFLKKDFTKNLGNDFVIYNPKILVEKYKKNKLIKKEFDLLGDYLFCFHKKFHSPSTIRNLKFSRGLKYFLNGFIQSQNEIENFVMKCKNAENDNGYISKNFVQLNLNTKYKFMSGPFSEKIFEVVRFQKNTIDIFLGNIKTRIKQNNYLFNSL